MIQSRKHQNTCRKQQISRNTRILEAAAIEQTMKEKVTKQYIWRTRKFETKLCNRNIIRGINT